MTPEQVCEVISTVMLSDRDSLIKKGSELLKDYPSIAKASVMFIEVSSIIQGQLCPDFLRGIVLTLMVLEQEKVNKVCDELEVMLKDSANDTTSN